MLIMLDHAQNIYSSKFLTGFSEQNDSPQVPTS